MLKKLFCLFLCFILASSVLVLTSCEESGTAEELSAGEQSKAEEGIHGVFIPKVKNRGGVDVNIPTYDSSYEFSTCQVATEEVTGEPINDAFFERNAIIQDRFGINTIAHYASEGEDYIQVLDFANGASGSGTLYFYTTLLGQKDTKGANIMSLLESKRPVFQAGITSLLNSASANKL